jgi:hypothetical protein
MPKRGRHSETLQAAAKRGSEAAAEARALRLRNEALAFDPPPASVTGSSSSTLCSSAVAPADDLLRVAAPAAAAPAAPDGAMETGGSHATVRLPAPPAGKPRARAAALSLPMCAPMRTHARTSCTRLRCGAGCFGGFCCTDRALHVGRAAACLAGPAAVCLPLHPPVACARARSIAVCSAAMPKWLRMPAMLTALRRKTRGACMPPSARPLDETAREPEVCRTSSRA